MSTAYTDYIIEHCENVRKAYDWLVDHKIIKNEYLQYIIHHDISKWTDEEFKAYDAYFYGKAGKTAAVKEAFNFAWLHHIHHNPHHWQHWVLINDDDGTKALEMPEEYLIELVCDWWSFSHKTGKLDEIFDYYKSHKANLIMHKNSQKRLEELLDKIKEALENDKA